MSWPKVLLYFGIVVIAFILSSYLTVSILLTTGETVICPDVRGKTVDDAKHLVESKGLSLSVMRYERRNDVPSNHITVQKPEANISTRKGRIVLVIVSEGPELIPIPALTGKPVEDAENILKGINVEVEKTIYVPSQKAGKVIAQVPKAGEGVLEKKQGVILFVGKEQKMLYVMPDVRNLDYSELVFELERKDIKYKTTSVRNERLSYSKPAIETSVPIKTVFKADEEIEIKVLIGGSNE